MTIPSKIVLVEYKRYYLFQSLPDLQKNVHVDVRMAQQGNEVMCEGWSLIPTSNGLVLSFVMTPSGPISSEIMHLNLKD